MRGTFRYMRIAHLRCGSDLLPSLDAARIPGPRLVWADPLCQGPLAAGPRSEWRDRRADFIALQSGEPLEQITAALAAEDAALDALDADELCLWFEHDLYDQAILLHLVARLGRLARPLSVVCRGAWPGVTRFVGLVQIPPEGLRTAFAERIRLGPVHVEAAEAAWTAMTGDDPSAVHRVATDGTLASFDFAADALVRWLEELPSVEDGLGRMERQALDALQSGPLAFATLFGTVAEREARPWIGDSMLRDQLWRLTLETVPLVLLEGDRWRLTAEGDAVLRGELHRVALNGVTHEQGGWRLTGRNPAWLWNRAARRPERQAS